METTSTKTLLEDAPLPITHSNGNNIFARSVLRDVDLDGDGFDDLVFSNSGADHSEPFAFQSWDCTRIFGATQTGIYDDTES